jgi:hypothetical protein
VRDGLVRERVWNARDRPNVQRMRGRYLHQRAKPDGVPRARRLPRRHGPAYAGNESRGRRVRCLPGRHVLRRRRSGEARLSSGDVGPRWVVFYCVHCAHNMRGRSTRASSWYVYDRSRVRLVRNGNVQHDAERGAVYGVARLHGRYVRKRAGFDDGQPFVHDVRSRHVHERRKSERMRSSRRMCARNRSNRGGDVDDAADVRAVRGWVVLPWRRDA